jgi:hypothetical protein
MPEEERTWLVEQAAAHKTTLNGEMMSRIMAFRDQGYLLTLRNLAEYSAQLLRPYQIEAHERAHYGDVLQAADDIVALIIAGANSETLRAAIDKYQLARRTIDIEAGRKLTSRGHH